MSRDIKSQVWGQSADGREVVLFSLINRAGLIAKVSTLGAALIELWVPDRAGRLEDIVLGFDDFASYLVNKPYFGVTIGRVANRIAGAQFELGNRTYRLECNDGPNALHGGRTGFHQVLWNGEAIWDETGVGVRLRYISPDGEAGYPGHLTVTVEYRLRDSGELEIQYFAETDQATPVNLTNHSYFNLGYTPDILTHELSLSADQFLPVDANRVPTGEVHPVEGSPMNFVMRRPIGAHLAELTNSPVGYDHTFVLRPACRTGAVAAEVVDPQSGRRMCVSTTEPGIQLYTGNFLDGSIVGKQGRAYRQYGGVCLETQHFPDAVHHRHFPSIILDPGKRFRSVTSYRFDVV